MISSEFNPTREQSFCKSALECAQSGNTEQAQVLFDLALQENNNSTDVNKWFNKNAEIAFAQMNAGLRDDAIATLKWTLSWIPRLDFTPAIRKCSLAVEGASKFIEWESPKDAKDMIELGKKQLSNAHKGDDFYLLASNNLRKVEELWKKKFSFSR